MNKNKTINKKIYIIGNVASGKTTLAKQLSKYKDKLIILTEKDLKRMYKEE